MAPKRLLTKAERDVIWQQAQVEFDVAYSLK